MFHFEHLKAGLVLTLVSPGLLAGCAVWIWHRPDRVRLIATVSILASWGPLICLCRPLLQIVVYPSAAGILGVDLLELGFFFIESSAAFSLAMAVFAFVVLPKKMDKGQKKGVKMIFRALRESS